MNNEPHSSTDDVNRVAITARRRRILSDNWEDDVRGYGDTHYRREGTEHLSFVNTTFNPLKNLTGQLATLYDVAPTVTIPSAPAQDVSALVTPHLLALWPQILFMVIGLNECAVRLDRLSGGRIAYRMVTPDVLREVIPDNHEPDRPVALRELRWLRRPGRVGWAYEVFDLRNPDAPVFKVIEVNGDAESDATALYYPTLAPGDYPWRALPVDGAELGAPILPYVLYHLRVNSQLFNPLEGEELVEGTLGIAISHSCLHHGVITNPSYSCSASLLFCLQKEDAIYRNSFGGVSPASLTPDRLISKEGLRRARLARELSQRMGDQELLRKAAALFNAWQGERIYPENPDDWHIVYDQN